MKRILFIFILALLPLALHAGPDRTLKSQMEVIHEVFGVNFVYDSSLDLDRIAGHAGNDVLKETDNDVIKKTANDVIEKTVKDVLSSRHSRLDRESLEASLAALFKDTGIEYEIMKKYIVLTKAGSKKKPKDYTIFIEEQHDTIDESRITAIIDRRRNAAQTGLERIDASAFKRGFASLSALMCSRPSRLSQVCPEVPS